ncbi:MAG: substrate-binding domain-containing protein [Anaerolineales bacterium]
MKFQFLIKMPIPDQSPTLKNIADIAGVSVGTVSAALNDRPTVAPETRARVMDVAVSLGYDLKFKPRPPEGVGIAVIGLLIKHDLGLVWDINPFYSRIQLGVTNTCQRHNISLMVANIEVDSSNHPVQWPAMINQQRIDGLIMAGAFIDDTVQMIKRKSDLPIVLVDSYAPNLRCDSIVTDNIGGARKAVTHLIENGHTQIGLAGWNPLSPPSIHQRKRGYLETLSEYGLQPFIVETELSRLGGQVAVWNLLEREKQVTALFCCNDETAIGALNAIHELGLKVPQEVSVIGFDNIDLAGETTPALTTVHVHKSWMGSLGVQALIERARNPLQPKITTVLATDLILRETVAQCSCESK